MNSMKLFLLLTSILLGVCSPARVETDYGGNGDFIVHNKSIVPIRVAVTKVPQRGSDIDTSAVIQPDSSRIILFDAMIGSNVTPQTSLSDMEILTDSTGVWVLLYSQNPIDQSKWIIEKRHSGDFGHTDNTFVFYDSLVAELKK
jgi:hypothetical protein